MLHVDRYRLIDGPASASDVVGHVTPELRPSVLIIAPSSDPDTLSRDGVARCWIEELGMERTDGRGERGGVHTSERGTITT